MTWKWVILGFLATFDIQAAELRVPACTAYLEPDVEGAEVSARGITGWRDPGLKVAWYGEIRHAGSLDCSLVLGLEPGAESRLRLSVAGQWKESVAKGADGGVVVPFGSFNLQATGYHKFTLESLSPKDKPFGDPKELVLSGAAAEDAHFNLKPRRNAASVHLAYVPPVTTNIDAFYCEVTAVEDPIWTFYMACGWNRGYFGMQVNSPTERRIIFSVWDSGDEAVDRAKVREQDRVTLVDKGQGVYSGDFGNEGTGGHSHLKYLWKTEEKQRFLLTAKPTDATHTIYAGYYFHPDEQKWFLISSWKAPKAGSYLKGLHSFSENFGGANGHLRRKALFGHQWVHQAGGTWNEVLAATFSHDQTGRGDRLDRFMGVEKGEFFLSHGGFVPGFTKFGEKFSRPIGTGCPSDFPPGW